MLNLGVWDVEGNPAGGVPRAEIREPTYPVVPSSVPQAAGDRVGCR